MSYTYDTSCPRFYFVESLPDRIFVGDVVDLSIYTETEILEEPLGFDTAKFELSRDRVYHGFNYDLTLDTLGFERGFGYEFLKTKFINGGTDAKVHFIFGYGQLTSLEVAYIGRVDFNEFSLEDNEIVSVNLINDDFGSLLTNNFDIDQPTVLNDTILLKSKALPKRLQYLFNWPRYVVGTTIPIFDPAINCYFAEAYRDGLNFPIITKADSVGYLYFNDGRGGDSDFNSFFEYDFQVDDSSPLANPNTAQKYIFNVEELGNYVTTINLKLSLVTGGVVWTDLQYQNSFSLSYLVTSDDGATIIDSNFILPTVISEAGSALGYDISLEYSGNFSIELSPNQLVYIYVNVNTAAFPVGGVVNFIYGRSFNFDTKLPQLVVVGQTVVEDSFSGIGRTFYVLNSVSKQSVDVAYDPVVSDFFDTAGCMYNLVLTNGFNIRNTGTAEQKKLKSSLKKLVDGLQAIFNLGWGIEYDELGRETIRLERASYFYKSQSILTLDGSQISDFSLKVDSSAYYNELEIGYSKYTKSRETDKQGSIDDVHTKHYYHTPIKTNKNKKSIISDIVISAYEIELTRRKQFDVSSDSTSSNEDADEDTFGIIITEDSESAPSATLTIPNSLITSESPFIISAKNGTNPLVQLTLVPLTTGEVVTFTGSDGTVQQRTVSFYNTSSTLEFDVLSGNFVVLVEVTIGFVEAFTGTTGALPITIQKAVDAEAYFVPETSEPFVTIDDVISPSTYYNLRLTPKRMLLNWGNVLNGGFRALNDQTLVFKKGDGNIDCTTKLKSDFDCLIGDIDRISVREGNDLELNDQTWGESYLFLPINVEFNYPLTFDELNTIRKAMRGQGLPTENYGYITVPFCGDNYKVFIDKITFNPTQDEAKIEGRLKEI